MAAAVAQHPLPSLAGTRGKPSKAEGNNLEKGNSARSLSTDAQAAPPGSLNPEYVWDSNRLRKFHQNEPVVSVPSSDGNNEGKLENAPMPIDRERSKQEKVKPAKAPAPVDREISLEKKPIDGLRDLPTISTLPELDKSGVPPGSQQNKNGTELGSAIFSQVWENMKKMMGFSPECQHGGHKNLRGDCVCPKYYEGNLCEEIVCINNGTRAKAPSSFSEDICKCPYPDFVTGRHCETIRCHNGGRDLGNGHCSCVDGWYTGQFCQFYTSSWLVAVGLPLLGIAMIIICCVVCRLDLCPRRSSRRERRPRRRHQPQTQQPRATAQRVASSNRQNHRTTQINNQASLDQDLLAHESSIIIQENLLNEGVLRQLNGRQYVVRLEEIPNFNPRLLLTMEPSVSGPVFNKPVEPPPSYDQAVLCRPPTCLNPDSQPPTYSPPHSTNILAEAALEQATLNVPRQRPPLPRFRPPDPS